MKSVRTIAVLLAAAILAGGSAPQARACRATDREELVNFQQPGVPPQLLAKVSHGLPLSLEDVATLSQAGVHSGSLINYLFTFGRHFHLTAAQVEELHRSGAGADLIAYMTSSDARRSFSLF